MTTVKRLPVPVATNWDWQRHAACRGGEADLFFHPQDERGEARREREARALRICARCPVREECLAHALAVREPYGVWGGLGENELRALQARQRRVA